jgi:membrane-bound serine protease (ClpP class)
MRRISIPLSALMLAALFAGIGGTAQTPAPERPVVLKIQLRNEAITPVTARFITSAIRRAEEQRAAALIIMLDTPGGLVDSTREVVGGIFQSRVPVVVYVSPVGARAASAGVFITMAAHVAAMAPGTTIGAAHPVQIGGLPGSPPQQPERQTDEKKDEKTQPRATTPMEDKIVNDTVAWARAMAELRGRNTDWAARAVRESISAPASEALKENAVDLIAEDINDLLGKIEGREITLIDRKVNLQVAGADVRAHEMWWGERVLALLANPTLAFLLLIFGFYGILFELYTPGWGVGGTVGVICLILAFFALSVLPINYVGLALIGIALTMFVAEAFVPSYGFLTLGGVICLILGGVMLVDSPAGFMRISLWMIVPVALATAAITAFLVGSIVKSHRAPLLTGSEAMAHAAATADEDFVGEGTHYRGRVQTHGELWRAVSDTPVRAGDALQVDRRDGLTLHVQPAPQPAMVLPITKEEEKNIA